MRRLFKLILAVGIGGLMSVIGATGAMANQGPGPWP
jgi:hypothetical protein